MIEGDGTWETRPFQCPPCSSALWKLPQFISDIFQLKQRESSGIIVIKRNIANGWTEIQLGNGFYNVSDITNAVNKTVGYSLGWYTDANDSVIKINSNSV